MNRKDKILKMLEKEPNDAFLNFGLAMELIKENGHDEAIARFDLVIENDPDYTAAYHHKGDTLIGLGRLEEARSTLEAGVVAAQRIDNRHAIKEMTELLDGLPQG